MHNTGELLKNHKRVVITGGAGFIGGAMVRRLLKESNTIVFNIDKISYASDLTSIQEIVKKLGEGSRNKYRLIKVDLNEPKDTLSAIEAANPDLVFHLAAESHVDRSIEGPGIFVKSNINGTFNLLQAVLKHYSKLEGDRKAKFRFHHISTDEVYGALGDQGLFNEGTNYDPRSPYSATKASSDHLVRAWHHTYHLPVVLTNCSNNYGPWQFPEKLIPLAILRALEMQTIPLYGDGSNIRDWLHVEDHVDALLLAATRGRPGRSYCIGGENQRSNRQVLESICKILDKKQPRSCSHLNLIKEVEDRPGHDYRYAIDSSRIRRELSWSPFQNFEEGLSNTIDWYMNNLEWCRTVQQQSGYKGNRLGLPVFE